MKQVLVSSNFRCIWLCAVALFLFSSCHKDYIRGNGNVVVEQRSVGNFTDVEIMGPFEVELIPNSSPKIEIKAEDNVIGAIETGISGNSLYIRIRRNVQLRNHKPLKVYLSNPFFQEVIFKGSGQLTTRDTLQATLFKYQLDGSATADLTLKVDNLFVTINGSGSTTLAGSANTFNSTINGSGGVDAWDLPCKFADLTINGSGAFRVVVNEQLTAKIHGSGDIHFKGPATLISDIKGSGRIIR
ncbi:DUF2807 domain-containing protein [Chitinophaga silvatica]|uniref:DUF2807 domain-containing protein n=1 Tax=Chitinophaga silvatica TaxID=2282649 RepID=A0A3E1YC70_9BACT|nr:head GIN domain-containing protein [Chitinophaga silvatica]RFS23882.1 DUF2807 domain-containing protein [Chitinophaga silvatica]